MSGFFIIDSKDKRTEAAHFVSRLPASPLYSVEIKPSKRTRTLPQNGRTFLVDAIWGWP